MRHRFVIPPRTAALAAVLGALVLAGARPAAAERGRLGLIVGLNSADLDRDADRLGDAVVAEQDLLLGGDWTADRKRRKSAIAGAYFHLPVSGVFGVQFEGRYAGRGTEFDLADLAAPAGERTGQARYQLGYLELPVLARYDLALSERFGALLLAGPVFGLKTAADLETSGTDRHLETRDLNRAFHSFAVGAEIGIGVSMAANDAAKVMLQGRYYLGLTNVLDDDLVTTRPRDFSIVAAMEYGIGN